jgi:hypothetical protein
MLPAVDQIILAVADRARTKRPQPSPIDCAPGTWMATGRRRGTQTLLLARQVSRQTGD